ncbi:MAG TPA: PTPA-CTERM sorting domain-containing protein [Nodosilinea sp.]|nr:PTPA-CTERM sorting domain-containing protein [Nodosilinea sp.]
MSFNSLGLSASVVASVVGISALAISPVQAANLAPGSFTISGTNVSSVTNFSGSGDTEFTLNFDTSPLAIVSTSGVFSGLPGLTGTPNIATLNLTGTSPGEFTFGAKNSFITGLFQDGVSIVIDLNAGSLFGFINNPLDYGFSGILSGLLRAADGDVAVTNGTLSSFIIGAGPGSNQSSIRVSTTPIPTPALLPGLLGLGVGVLRKRKIQLAEPEA